MLGRSQTDGVDASSRAPTGIETPPNLELDDIYHILQTKRRRDVLRYLRQSDGRVPLRDLAEQVAAWEQETTVENLNSSERQRVYISLYQSHLPKLDNHGIVNYDKDRGWVEPTPRMAHLDQYLDSPYPATSADRWPLRYAGTVVLCSAFFAAVATEIVPISERLGTVIVLVTFATVTVVHALSTDQLRDSSTGDEEPNA
ncbi:DUF7344 domain-containing protein [Natrinema halophilum]|uniref:DUF7344 domain-containing protein n=1 Tax=Natrinema halophilum TaxID=1699371 RepID=A0A7D5H1J3_9EURY|nr:hypothetical protein [Natrinema halophilum]QLG48331.1 hypothetical protein HYG82_05445 [Natrinema halophilum]